MTLVFHLIRSIKAYPSRIRLVNDIRAVPEPCSVISNGTSISGDLRATTLRLYGQIQGNIHCDGDCFVSSTSVVSGNIRANRAEICGFVDGDLVINDQLILRSGTVIRGRISTMVLKVEDGVTFLPKGGATGSDAHPGPIPVRFRSDSDSIRNECRL
jgi:cytoskeletal protein CcmA (bactofilin family)